MPHATARHLPVHRKGLGSAGGDVEDVVVARVGACDVQVVPTVGHQVQVELVTRLHLVAVHHQGVGAVLDPIAIVVVAPVADVLVGSPVVTVDDPLPVVVRVEHPVVVGVVEQVEVDVG